MMHFLDLVDKEVREHLQERELGMSFSGSSRLPRPIWRLKLMSFVKEDGHVQWIRSTRLVPFFPGSPYEWTVAISKPTEKGFAGNGAQGSSKYFTQ